MATMMVWESEMVRWGLICLAVAVCWLLYAAYDFERRRRSESEGVPRGSSGWPLIGETMEFIASGYSSRPLTFMEKRMSMYGKVFKTHILGKAIIVSTDADVNKAVLQNQGNVFVPCYPKSVTELFGESSILRINGSTHRRVHSLIACFLKSPQLKARITRHIEITVQRSLSSWVQKQGPIYLQDEAKKITFEVLVKVLLSIDQGEDLDFMKREFEEFIKGLICLPIKLPGTRLYKSLQAKKRLLKMVRKIMDERKAEMGKTDYKGLLVKDGIDVLMCDTGELDGTKNWLPSDFISGNIIEMMIPGEETLPTAMTLAVKFLSDNQDVLARLVEENMELSKQKASSCQEYNWSDYMSLPFTQNVISETLRMANIINAVWRKALNDTRIKGHLIPKGWCVLASFTSIHMDEKNYENPYQFDPWRWEKFGVVSSNNTFTPFGGGQRLCPGLELSRLEISIFLHRLVTTFRWVAEEDDIIYFPTVRMKRKLPITILPIGANDKNSCPISD